MTNDPQINIYMKLKPQLCLEDYASVILVVHREHSQDGRTKQLLSACISLTPKEWMALE